MTSSVARTESAPRPSSSSRVLRGADEPHQDDSAVPRGIVASLRIACDALKASPDAVTCIGVVSHLPHDFVITSVVAHAERLADAYGFRAHMYVHEGRLDIRFERQIRTR